MRYVISVDLGATNVRVGLISTSLEIISVFRERSTKDDKDALANQIIRMIKSLPLDKYKVEAIGVSACGMTKFSHIEVLPNLNIKDFPLNKILEKEFNVPCEIANDANCTALSEATHGAGKDYNTSYFVTISSGIGGCLVYNKKLVDLPFELGHHLIGYKNNFYEIEEILSGNGLVKFCKINDLVIDNASTFFSLVEAKDEKALYILDEYVDQLAIMMNNLQLDYNTDTIILSGGVMKSIDLFFDKLQRKCDELISKTPLNKINFTCAAFDQDAGLMGGATLGLNLLK